MIQGGRHYGMDWLRIGAFGLLIFYHIGMYFVPWDWHVKTPHTMDWVAVPMLATNSWRLALLFAVSGYASAALFAKLDSRSAFLRSRTARLLVPLVFGMIVVIPVQPWIELSFKHGYDHGFLYFWSHDYFRFGPLDGIVLPTWQHLWFVAYLWVYTLWLGLLLVVLPARLRAWMGRAATRALTGPLLLVVPITLLALKTFVLFPGAGETHALFDDGPAHAAYFPIFLFGWLLFLSEALWVSVRRWWPVAAGLSVAAFVVVAGVELRYPGDTPAGPEITAIFGAARMIQGWCAIVALVGVADRFLNHDFPIRATLTEAVFPFYIIHQSIIVLVGWWLLPTGVGQAGAFAILLTATAAGCLAFYVIGRQIGPLRPLIGLARKDKLAAHAAIAHPKPATTA